ncbi:hypothetical protein ACJX0J_006136, partial [Zea mays]
YTTHEIIFAVQGSTPIAHSENRVAAGILNGPIWKEHVAVKLLFLNICFPQT